MTRRETWAVRLGIPSLAVTVAFMFLVWPLFWFGYGNLLWWMNVLWWGIVMPVCVASIILSKGQFASVMHHAIRDFRASHRRSAI